MDMTRTTPIPALNVESNTPPIKLFIKKHKLNYIARNIQNNSQIAKKITEGDLRITCQHSTSTMKKSTILVKLDIPERRHKSFPTWQSNQSFWNRSQKRTLARRIKTHYNRNNNNSTRYNNDLKFYTDATVLYQKQVPALESSTKNQKIKLKEKLSIKTVELIAIFSAINFGLKSNEKRITILTDSQSSCISISKHACIKKLDRFYEYKILQLADKNQNREIRIQWIPGHLGILDNEVADGLADMSDSTNSPINLNVKIPYTDIKRIHNDKIKEERQADYEIKSLIKGRRHRDIINSTVPKKPWFHNIKLSSADTRRIARLRSGHTYDKRFLEMVGITNNNNCDHCHVLEDSSHIITTCPLYDNIRTKYNRRGVAGV